MDPRSWCFWRQSSHPTYTGTDPSHLQTVVTPSAGGGGGGGRKGGGQDRAVRYLHKAMEGRCDPGDGYGIRTAEMCGLPLEIVEEARMLRQG